MSGITTHVLDTSSGQPAVGLSVQLSVREGDQSRLLAESVTDAEGRVRRFTSEPLAAGSYRLSFATAAYFRSKQQTAFFENVTLEFNVASGAEHYHVPLLLSPFGYTTYRGT